MKCLEQSSHLTKGGCYYSNDRCFFLTLSLVFKTQTHFYATGPREPELCLSHLRAFDLAVPCIETLVPPPTSTAWMVLIVSHDSWLRCPFSERTSITA